MVANLRSAFSDDPLSSEFSLRSSDSGAGAVCCFPALPKADFVGEGDIIALDSEAGFSCAGCCRLPFESITPPAAWTLVPLRGLPRRGYSSFQTTPPGTLFNLSFKVTCGEAGGGKRAAGTAVDGSNAGRIPGLTWRVEAAEPPYPPFSRPLPPA